MPVTPTSGQYRDGFGEPAYLEGALGRLETGQPLRAVDLQELSYAVGREAAVRLARTVEEDRARTARGPRSSTWWGRWFGPIHTSPELSMPVVRLIAALRSGAHLGRLEARTAVRTVGRATARAVTRRLRRGGRGAVRAVTRAQARNAVRRGFLVRGRRGSK
jgi:hypothetical protein